jgi:hypothetical protein
MLGRAPSASSLPDWSGAWFWPFDEFEAEGNRRLKARIGMNPMGSLANRCA